MRYQAALLYTILLGIIFLFGSNISAQMQGSSQTKVYTNEATVSASQLDTNPSNNTSSVTDTIQAAGTDPKSDLAIQKSVSRATASVGDTLEYTLKYQNIGLSTALQTIITDTLPPQT